MKDRVVRDLWWAVTSPGLMDEGYGCTVPAFDQDELLPAFRALDARPEALHRAVAGSLGAERPRLGAYFEDLIEFFVRDVAGHRDLVSGVVIREEKRTVGELDLLFRDGPVCRHWELAVKFYMHVPGLVDDPSGCYLGPETRDRLHLKMERLRDHQLPLAGTAAAAEALASWQPLESAALVRGRLYYPASSDWSAGPSPTLVDSSHLRGWWCQVDRAEELLPDADSYALLTRAEWFAPVDASLDKITRWSRGQACKWAATAASTWPSGEARSHVVACLDADGGEVHRGFLTSVGWPGAVPDRS